MLKLSIYIMLKIIDENQKSDKNKIIATLRAAIAFAKKVIEESKIQTVLNEVRKLVINSSNRDT